MSTLAAERKETGKRRKVQNLFAGVRDALRLPAKYSGLPNFGNYRVGPGAELCDADLAQIGRAHV